MNEAWFDSRNGELLIGREAAAPCIDEAGPDIVPLPDLLKTKHFPYKYGDYPKVTPEGWDKERCAEVGRWALNLLAQPEGGLRPLTQNHLARLAILGLSPMPGRHFRKEFTTFSAYKEHISSPIRYDRVRYADWSIAQFEAYAQEIITAYRRLPIREDYDALFAQGMGPSSELIGDRVGGIDALHDLLGYPNVGQWEPEEFVEWGAKVIEANEGTELSLFLVEILSARRRGPSGPTIAKKSYPWSEFKQRTKDKYHEKIATRNEKIKAYHDLINDHKMPRSFLALDDERLLSAAGKYLIITDLAPTIPPRIREEIAIAQSDNLITRLRGHDPKLSAGAIEVSATIKDVSNDIWPMQESLGHLYVDPDELEATRRQRLTRIYRNRAARKARQRPPSSDQPSPVQYPDKSPWLPHSPRGVAAEKPHLRGR